MGFLIDNLNKDRLKDLVGRSYVNLLFDSFELLDLDFSLGDILLILVESFLLLASYSYPSLLL